MLLGTGQFDVAADEMRQVIARDDKEVIDVAWTVGNFRIGTQSPVVMALALQFQGRALSLLQQENILPMSSFTVAEAAILAATEPKAVHNTIDDLLPEVAGDQRVLSRLDVVILRAITILGPLVTREGKRQIVAEMKRTPRRTQIRVGDALTVDVGKIRKDMSAAMRTVQQLRHLAVSDPEILGGEPVFKGTRVPVRMIAAMLEQGESSARLVDGYPSLTRQQIELAPLWARTYPTRGRPPIRPWADAGQKPIRTYRIPLKRDS